jgi:hypothetical protein
VNIIQEGMVVDFKVSLLFQNRWGDVGGAVRKPKRSLVSLPAKNRSRDVLNVRNFTRRLDITNSMERVSS